jgi:predicted nucleotidyltransferase
MVYNTLAQTEIKILRFFATNIGKQFTIREISKRIKTTYSITHEYMQKLIRKNLIRIEKQGKSSLCSFNYKEANKDVFYVEQIRADNMIKKNKNLNVLISDIKSKINYSFYTLVLFGSFAKETQNNRSDIDLLVIIPESEGIERFERGIHSVIDLYPLEIHLIVINEKSFKEMITSKQETNIAKEVVNKHIIFYGVENYYKLISGA